MSWRPPSYADRFALTAPQLVRCSCGVRTWAIDLVDVAAVPLEARRKREEFWCGGCAERAFAERRTTRAAYLTALGAPAELIEKAALLDEAQALL